VYMVLVVTMYLLFACLLVFCEESVHFKFCNLGSCLHSFVCGLSYYLKIIPTDVNLSREENVLEFFGLDRDKWSGKNPRHLCR